MARGALSDRLAANTFWLSDASLIGARSLPVLSPLAGFSAITAPEITGEIQDISEANNPGFNSKVLKGADTGSITLTKGQVYDNGDFWAWVMAAIYGDTSGSLLGFVRPDVGAVSPRRDLLLVQFFPHFPVAVTPAPHTVVGKGLKLAQQTFGPSDLALRVPAKAWLLKNCLPFRYKPASDFDAASSEISLTELEVAVEGFEEISLAS